MYERYKYERYGHISSDDGDTLAHAKQASQGSFIMLGNNSSVHAEYVYFKLPLTANSNAISIGFVKEQHEELNKSRKKCKIAYNFKAIVKFELKHSYFNRLHQALDNLPKLVIQKLIPANEVLLTCKSEENDYRVYPPLYENIELDQHVQMKALYAILKSSPALPILVAGPFGTGKTRLLARAAYEILKKKWSRVLICAHHQASADTFVKYFGEIKTDKKKPWDVGMLRVIPPNDIHSETREKYNNFYKNRYDVKRSDLIKNRLVITTLGTAPHLSKDINAGFFTDILIDEGAQTREPETVGPLTLAGHNTRIIIAGDHCQVKRALLTCI